MGQVIRIQTWVQNWTLVKIFLGYVHFEGVNPKNSSWVFWFVFFF